MRAALIIAGTLAGLGAFMWSRRAQATTTPVAGNTWEDNMMQDIGYDDTWSPPAGCDQYRSAFAAAEQKYGLPAGLIARMAYQESRCRADIISGQTVSPAGAVGIMQIVPRWHPGVNPLDPYASIDYAARYMSQLYRQFGDWKKALAAYNWGPNNVRTYGMERMPLETRNYVAQISADVGIV